MVERNDANKLSTPFDDVGRPGVTDAGGYHGNDGAVLDLALLERELEGEYLVDLAYVAVVLEVDGLVLGEAEVGEHGLVAGALDVQDVEIADVLAGHAGFAQRFVYAVVPVGHGGGVEHALHLGGVHEPEHAELGHVLRGHGLDDAADLGAAGVHDGAVAHYMGAEQLVFS